MSNKKDINGKSIGNFYPELSDDLIDDDSLAFVFINKELMLIDGAIPFYKNIHFTESDIKYVKCVGKIDKSRCFLIELKSECEIVYEYKLFGLRELYAVLPEPQLKAAMFAFQIMLWNFRTKYCGICGSHTEENKKGEMVKICTQCNANYYPKISPSIIVAIKKDNKLLMAKHKKQTRVIYSVLAGFVNPGESLEECVHREVKEEAGIEVTNIKYFGSQPWPFPDSLMVGFTADYSKGEIKPDNNEIIDLKWFSADEIPEWPDKVSIARSLIDDFIDKNTSNNNRNLIE